MDATADGEALRVSKGRSKRQSLHPSVLARSGVGQQSSRAAQKMGWAGGSQGKGACEGIIPQE